MAEGGGPGKVDHAPERIAQLSFCSCLDPEALVTNFGKALSFYWSTGSRVQSTGCMGLVANESTKEDEDEAPDRRPARGRCIVAGQYFSEDIAEGTVTQQATKHDTTADPEQERKT